MAGPKSSFAFETRYATLNSEQRAAVDALEGPVTVIAGPGTGKTEILTMRIANILRGGTGGARPKKTSVATSPERILALTFTESGAVSMRRRLAELVGQVAYRVEISTFHGFANRIIRDYPDYFPEIVGSVSITEIDQVSIVRRLIDTPVLALAKLRPFGDSYYYLRDILHAIEELKKQSVSPEAFAAIAAREREEFYTNPDLYNASGKYEGKMKGKYDAAAKQIEKNLELVRVYEAYQAALRRAKQYDYADMIMFVALALEKNEDLRRVLQDTYDYFLVDEHQDTNDAQNKIIEMIADGENGKRKMEKGGREVPHGPNLFVVGDEKQAIFRFQGASLENFHYFKNRYPDVKLISLRSNYRSTQAILDAAQGVSPRAAGAELEARAGHPESPAHLAALSSSDVEYYFIARKIKELLEDAHGKMPAAPAPEEIAVLYRDNRDAVWLVRMLEKLDVPFNIESDQDVLGDLEIKKLVRVLRAVQHYGSDVWLAEALHVDFLGVAPIELYKMTVAAARSHGKLKMYDILRSGYDGHSGEGVHPALFAHFSNWKRAVENRGAVEAFEMIVRESGFLAAVLRHPSGAEKLAKLHALFDLLKSFVERDRKYTLADFFTYLDLMEEHGVAVKSKTTVRLPGRVRLMTAHRSKGMEFEYVFIMNAVDRKWGSRFHREKLKLPKAIYGMEKTEDGRQNEAEGKSEEEKNADATADTDADERNVFYVALTRARRELFVTMSKTDRDGKEQLPTQFIAELGEDVLAPLDTAPYENDFALHGDEIEFGVAGDEPAAGGHAGAQKSHSKSELKPEFEDTAFLNALFEEQGISVTALNNYLECPWAYFYRNLVRIPESPNKNLAFGNAVHAALKSYFDAFDGGAGGASEDKGKSYLVARFEEELAHEPIPDHEYEEALAKGCKALAAFYDTYHAAWVAFAAAGGRAANEVRVAGITLDDGTAINGKLDRIEFLDGAVRVIDYKTGKPKTRNDIEGNTQSSDGNYKRQLVFYKLLLDKEGNYAMRDGVIQFIEPDDKGKAHREEFAITGGEVAVLEQLVKNVAREIRELAFWDKGCREKDCQYCALREMVIN